MIVGCPYIPVRSFCIFVGVSMVVNYILNLIIIPGLLIWIEVNLQENQINRIVKSVSLRSAHEDNGRDHSHSGRIEKFFKL